MMRITVVDASDELTEEMRGAFERRLLFALSRFDSRVVRVRLHVSSVTGRRGNRLGRSRVTVGLRNGLEAKVVDEDSDVTTCVSRSIDRVGREVARLIRRGQATNGNSPNDKSTTGKTTNGKTTNGKTTNGKTTNGETTNGKTTDGQATNGQATGGKPDGVTTPTEAQQSPRRSRRGAGQSDRYVNETRP